MGEKWLMRQSPPDAASTKSCCEDEAGRTLDFRAGSARRPMRVTAALLHCEEAAGILRDAVEAYFKVQMRAG
jgi:hypothetical protein